MMRVLLHEGAIRDIRAIVAQLSEDSTRAVDEFFDRAAEFVARHSEAGHPCGRFRRWNFRKFPYHLLYEVISQGGELWIMAVRHDRRHPSYGMQRRLPDPWLL